ncbi:hypothetical protein A5819_003593 [Enterococcus sp. 7E2_DIV0204]|uniref:hypothetical protein n=1 Tax=Enterococcus sp. 7E2_DIV0204 TaxID=1834188 RepID=UPI000B641E44|nr:hypothetical protein [Enterococcus sp. 7E2_DIV0204]OTN84043.1 hypothetical protein A5819_003593 [Enterococcus sp. 7E2_DIV0204]OTP47269.1 hypothetical protein A5884_003644 [Enterococcus sp. 7D2_DIV0200]
MTEKQYSSEEVDQLLFSLMTQNRKEFQTWLKENLLTKHEVLEYTDQSEHGLKQSVREHWFAPFFSKGEGRGKINLFLKSEAISYGKHKRKNVLKGEWDNSPLSERK